MMPLDYRPEVRIAFINPNGTVDTTGQQAFPYFETLPAVGDIIVEPAMLNDEPEAVVVVGRQFIKPPGEEPRWWIIVRPVDGSRWREVYQLDYETNVAFAQMRAEQVAGFEREFFKDKPTRRRRQKPRRSGGEDNN